MCSVLFVGWGGGVWNRAPPSSFSPLLFIQPRSLPLSSPPPSLLSPLSPPPPPPGRCCIQYAPFDCTQAASLDLVLPDSTPLICTPPDTFYIGGPAGIANNINKLAAANKPPFFITVYGLLKWTASGLDPTKEFWTAWGNITGGLDPNIVPVGAQEMARLAREAGGDGSLAKLKG